MRAAHGSPAGPGLTRAPAAPDRACGLRSRRSRSGTRWRQPTRTGVRGTGSGRSQCGARTHASLSRKFRESVPICTRLSECVVPAAASTR
ncbi:hypothetical protein BURCENBC7_AP2867 [Burkholderia cenocepacia BC7]|nr:hypothetical protein BURCENK562V_C3429 [Burkholderia cenocepacia K56-2Valvano]ERI30784.1 hypothetical protein BURCENBC7_AP2867 [Burkholderia cenocepacia BC7]